jgi:co-chaperonin GroES (HSP10)
MTKVNIQPFPGKVLVQPVDEVLSFRNHIEFRGGKTPTKGKIIRMHKPEIKVGQEQFVSSYDTPIPLKEGDIVFYENDYMYEFDINGSIYHLISTYNIVAKIG